VEDSAGLISFYERGYSLSDPEAARYGAWRALSAVGKAEHVVALCEAAGLEPASTLDVGCGDGALLCELRARGFGGRLSGLEITDAAVAIAGERAEIESVARYDGVSVPAQDGSYELGILSHVLEHVRNPAALLAEVGRACRAVVIEVPLEANLSARRASKREHADEVGHLQRLDRGAVRELIELAGLRLSGELEDPLSLEVHRFFATSRSARARATAKWAMRTGLHRATPGLARRCFTLHYAALCVGPDA
jgi:SAM-dependent methyltransferase